MSHLIAGHDFDFRGICRRPREHMDGSQCPIRWNDISGTTLDDAGQPGISHIGTVNTFEIYEIIDRAKKEREQFDIVMRPIHAASGG